MQIHTPHPVTKEAAASKIKRGKEKRTSVLNTWQPTVIDLATRHLALNTYNTILERRTSKENCPTNWNRETAELPTPFRSALHFFLRIQVALIYPCAVQARTTADTLPKDNKMSHKTCSTFLSVSSMTLSTTSLSLPLEQTYTVCSARPYVGKITPLEKAVHLPKAENISSGSSSDDIGYGRKGKKKASVAKQRLEQALTRPCPIGNVLCLHGP